MMRRGFTLLELIVAAALGALMLMATAQVFRAAMNGRERLQNRGADLAALRRTFETLSRDLHSATLLPEDTGLAFGVVPETAGSGGDVLQFAATVGEPLLAGRPASETVLVQYVLAEDPRTGVPTFWRYETPYPLPEGAAPGQSADTRVVPLLAHVSAVSYLYYSAEQQTWLDTWEGQSGLPGAIRVDLVLEGERERGEGRQESWIFTLPAAGATPAVDAAASEGGP